MVGAKAPVACRVRVEPKGVYTAPSLSVRAPREEKEEEEEEEREWGGSCVEEEGSLAVPALGPSLLSL
jgi:hypothetical protein